MLGGNKSCGLNRRLLPLAYYRLMSIDRALAILDAHEKEISFRLNSNASGIEDSVASRRLLRDKLRRVERTRDALNRPLLAANTGSLAYSGTVPVKNPSEPHHPFTQRSS
jgi:hypothetical protein